MRGVRLFLLVALVSGITVPAAAQQSLDDAPKSAPESVLGPGWNPDVRLGLGLAQSSFTQNWAGDEVGTVSWLATADMRSENQMHPKFRWLNATLGFDQTHQRDASRVLAPVKSSDKIRLRLRRFTLGRWVGLSRADVRQPVLRAPAAVRNEVDQSVPSREFAGLARAF
jgi:hypothetical protein